jgi:hypothetical protein
VTRAVAVIATLTLATPVVMAAAVACPGSDIAQGLPDHRETGNHSMAAGTDDGRLSLAAGTDDGRLRIFR